MGPLKSGLASASLATTSAASDCSAAVSKYLAANISAPSLFTLPVSIIIFFCAVGLFAISIRSCKSSNRCTGFTVLAGVNETACTEGKTDLECLSAASIASFDAAEALTIAASSAAIDFFEPMVARDIAATSANVGTSI